MKNKKRNPVVPVMFEEKMKKQIELAAKKEGRTFASMVRRILAKWLEIGGTLLLIVLFFGCSNPTSSVTEYWVGFTSSNVPTLFWWGNNMYDMLDKNQYVPQKLPVNTKIIASYLDSNSTYYLHDTLIVTKDTVWQPK